MTYHLTFAEVAVSGSWQLQAAWSDGYWLCARAGSEGALRKAVFKEGVELKDPTGSGFGVWG